MKTLVCDDARPAAFLAGTLGPADEAAFVAHLDACERCRGALDRLAGDPASWADAKALRVSDAPPAGPDTDPATGLPADLAFLAPSDDPASLGRIGGYEVRGLIGRGGMGAVFKAFDPPLGRVVAVKVIDPRYAADPATRARFAREARAMAAVSHPHVVPVYAVDEHRVPPFLGNAAEPARTLPFFAMEYVPGETLAGRLGRTGPLSVTAAVRVARQVALGLAAAHEQGLIHRDVKPANVLLERGVERVRVADFGLARGADAGAGGGSQITALTGTGVAAGTPEYMAPEQVRGEPCDGRADLFALGGLLHASLTGHSPFRGGGLYEVLRRVVEEPAADPRAANPDVPAWLAAFVGKLLAKAPADRFPTAEDVAGRLAAELAHRERPGSPAPPRDYLPPPRRWPRVVAGAVCAAGLCAVAVWPAPAPDAPEFTAPPAPLAFPLASPKPRDRDPSALGSELEIPPAPALDAALTAAARAAAALDAPAAPPAADPWRDDLAAAAAEADRLLRDLNRESRRDGPPPPARRPLPAPVPKDHQ